MIRRFVPRYSLRSLLLVALLVGVVLQGSLTVQKRARDQRAATFTADITQLVIYSQRIPREYAPQLLNFIDRRIERFPEGEGISAHKRRQLRQMVQAERAKLHRKLATH